MSLLTIILFVQDHFERGSLNLKTLKFRVLDEADEMLNMGFVDDVETILGKLMPPLSEELLWSWFPDFTSNMNIIQLKPCCHSMEFL